VATPSPVKAPTIVERGWNMDLEALRQHMDDYHDYKFPGEEGTGTVLLHTLHRSGHRIMDADESNRILPHEYSEEDKADDDEHAV
jgi:hypothetical protein